MILEVNSNVSIASVSSKHVLSAAHCIHEKQKQRKNEDKAYIVVGSFNLNTHEDSQQKIYVERFSVHSDWDPNSYKYDADIAVITLKVQIRYTQYIRPICLPSNYEAQQDIAGRDGYVAGWGKKLKRKSPEIFH